jgi:hypothetical protein
MNFALLRGNGLAQNVIFDPGSPANRDNCFSPYILLRDHLRAAGIQVDTADILQPEPAVFEIHQDVQPTGNAPDSYLLMFETEFVTLRNADPAALKKYRKIFTWNDDLVDGARFTKINFPNPVRIHGIDGFAARDRFCCLIAGNRTLDARDQRILYPERVAAIRWFESNAPRDFDLYGVDWDTGAYLAALSPCVPFRVTAAGWSTNVRC